MIYTVDMAKLVKNFKNINETQKNINMTDGMKYLHENFFLRYIRSEEIKVADIDFSCFTQDDIKEYKKYYNSNEDMKIDNIEKIAKIFSNSMPAVSVKKSFF